MLQQKKPEDFVIATGKQYTVKQFINLVLNQLKIKYSWKGNGIKTKCIDENGKTIIECDKKYFRPLEVDTLLGDARKARRELKWKPKKDINQLIKEMINHEVKILDNA